MQSVRGSVYRLPLLRGILRRLGALEAFESEQRTLRDQRLMEAKSVKSALEQLARLEKQVSNLTAICQSGHQIDLVDFGELQVFMYMGDLTYEELPVQIRHFQFRVENDTQTTQMQLSGDSEPATKINVVNAVLNHYWRHQLEFTFIDVGCQYGTSALRVAQFIRASGRTNRVICFEPGMAGSLVSHNIALNGLEERVTFEPMAVSNVSRPVLLWGELGHSENNRIVNRDLSLEAFSMVVRATTIDDYVANQDTPAHLVLKIDTQGAEYQVLQGMKQTLASRYVTCILEFTPGALGQTIRPDQLLAEISQWAYLVDLGQQLFARPDSHAGNEAYVRIQPDDYGRFISEVSRRPYGWTDLLVVPKHLPGALEMLSALTDVMDAR